MISNVYTCTICKGVYNKGWSDEEAEKELEQKFGKRNIEDCDVVCDDCYNKFFGQPDQK